MFNSLGTEFSNIKDGFEKAVSEEVKSQKMKTELISNVSHDLKTPLTSIITYIDLLKDEQLDYEKRKEYLDTLEMCIRDRVMTHESLYKYVFFLLPHEESIMSIYHQLYLMFERYYNKDHIAF